MNDKNNKKSEDKWSILINKHKIRSEIWAILDLHIELNVTQITHYLEQSKTTVARHLNLMERDGLLISRKPEKTIKGRIPPKLYRNNPKFKAKEELEENLFKKEINLYRKVSYNIKKLLNYLDPLLDLLESQLDNPEKAKEIYDEYLSFIPSPLFYYFDKGRSEALLDIHSEYSLKLEELSLKEISPEDAFVGFDIFLPLAALFELKKRELKSKG